MLFNDFDMMLLSSLNNCTDKLSLCNNVFIISPLISLTFAVLSIGLAAQYVLWSHCCAVHTHARSHTPGKISVLTWPQYCMTPALEAQTTAVKKNRQNYAIDGWCKKLFLQNQLNFSATEVKTMHKMCYI